MTLRLHEATYRYPGASTAVIRGVDLEVGAGEVTGLVGPNGAGKTTLCLIASGLAPASIGGRLDGSVRLDGQETRDLRPFEAAARCGILFQNPLTQLSGTTTSVWEEVAFGPANLGVAAAEISARVAWALGAVGIADLAARDPERLSGGQAQLVALASILALGPRVLVLDEPTSLLDPAGTRLVGGALASLASERGTAMVLVEHKADLLASTAHLIARMDAGHVVQTAATGVLLADPELEAAGVAAPSPLRLARRLLASGGTLGPRVLAALGLDAATELAEADPDASSSPGLVPELVRATGVANGAIELDDVVFDYPGPVRALASVSLRIKPGETVAIVGQNGSGKSTLARHLNGLLRPTSGRVRIDGRDIRQVHVADLAHRVGLAFQDPDRQIFAGLVRTEVAFGPRNLGVRDPELGEVVRGSLEALGLAGESETHPYDLGYSRRKLLSLASIVALRSPVLVLDEPTTGQDARGVAMIERLVAALAGAGRTVIAITHDMRFAAENFDRVIAMRAGQVVLDGPPGEVFAEGAWPALASTYLEPPFASVVGSRLGLGSTPTAAALAAALGGGLGAAPGGGARGGLGEHRD
ncbi:MAG TPA: ABC transporter ATP-binding protein [Candidatus Binatus sp.]|nr:ABC transporter ATP-binding protein [Candidatus Binatus sp.]